MEGNREIENVVNDMEDLITDVLVSLIIGFHNGKIVYRTIVNPAAIRIGFAINAMQPKDRSIKLELVIVEKSFAELVERKPLTA